MLKIFGQIVGTRPFVNIYRIAIGCRNNKCADRKFFFYPVHIRMEVCSVFGRRKTKLWDVCHAKHTRKLCVTISKISKFSEQHNYTLCKLNNPELNSLLHNCSPLAAYQMQNRLFISYLHSNSLFYPRLCLLCVAITMNKTIYLWFNCSTLKCIIFYCVMSLRHKTNRIISLEYDDVYVCLCGGGHCWIGEQTQCLDVLAAT